MNSKKSKTSHPHRPLLNLSDKINLKRSDKCVALSILSICYTWKSIKKACKSNKFKISAPTWSDELELPDGSYLISDIQNYFEYVLKKHNKNVNIQSVKIQVNKIENKITF